MVSVTGSVTWISHGSSVIGKTPDPRRQQDEKHANRYRRKNRVKRKEGWHNGERRCRSPSRAQSKGRIPDSPTGVE